MAISHSIEPRQFSIVCDNCFTEITKLKYVQCHDCILDLCLLCFLDQTETSLHSKYHQYRVISRMGMDIYGKGWTLLQEILFIGGLETCGIGNWAGISNYIGEDKDTEDHFYNLFGIKKAPDMEAEVVEERFSNPYKGLVNSYMPRRKDFDTEYMNDYEIAIKDLSFSSEDDETKRRFVMAILGSYMRIVGFRNRRKHVMIDKNLMHTQLLNKNDEKAGEFINGIKCVAPYLTKTDFNMFFGGLYIEDRLYMLLKIHMSSSGNRINLSKFMSTDHLLLEDEETLCDTCKISPTLYLELKKEVVSYFLKKMEFTRYRLRRMVGPPDQRVNVLFDFFRTQGWILKDTEDKS